MVTGDRSRRVNTRCGQELVDNQERVLAYEIRVGDVIILGNSKSDEAPAVLCRVTKIDRHGDQVAIVTDNDSIDYKNANTLVTLVYAAEGQQ